MELCQYGIHGCFLLFHSNLLLLAPRVVSIWYTWTALLVLSTIAVGFLGLFGHISRDNLWLLRFIVSDDACIKWPSSSLATPLVMRRSIGAIILLLLGPRPNMAIYSYLSATLTFYWRKGTSYL